MLQFHFRPQPVGICQNPSHSRGGVRVGSMGSIEPTDFWSLYVVNPWIFWQNISGIEYDYHYLDSSLVLNPLIEIPT